MTGGRRPDGGPAGVPGATPGTRGHGPWDEPWRAGLPTSIHARGIVLLTREDRARFGAQRGWELTPLSWRSLLRLACEHDAALRPLLGRAELAREDLVALVAAVEAVLPSLAAHSEQAWMAGMDRCYRLGRFPRPRDYWSTLRPQLRDLLAWLGETETRLRVVYRHPGAAAAMPEEAAEDEGW